MKQYKIDTLKKLCGMPLLLRLPLFCSIVTSFAAKLRPTLNLEPFYSGPLSAGLTYMEYHTQ